MLLTRIKILLLILSKIDKIYGYILKTYYINKIYIIIVIILLINSEY